MYLFLLFTWRAYELSEAKFLLAIRYVYSPLC